MSQTIEGARGIPIHGWLTGPLPADVVRSLERLGRAADVCRMAVMPDVHRAGEVCVGVALATGGLVYPAAVGGDIGCGMTAVRFDTRRASRLVDEAPSAYRDIRAVMRAQRELTAICRELKPLVNHKGS